MPIRGMILRMGASIGSVIWYSKELIGLFPVGEIQDMMTLPKIAKLNTVVA